MFKKLIFLVSFVFVLSTGITAQATPIPVSVNPAVESVIGEDGNVFPNQSYTSTFLLQVSDHIDGVTQGRRVTLISYDLSGLKSNNKQKYRKMSLSVLGFIPGNVDVYGVIEDQDNISEGLKWNNAPGVNNAQKVGYSVELDMDDLTDKLFSFTAPARDERQSVGASQALDDFINSDTDGIVTFLLAPPKGSKFVKMWSSKYPGGGIILNGEMTLGIDIAWVTETADRDEDGVQDDQKWTEWLIDEGYDLNLQPDRYLIMGDEQGPDDANDYVGELNTADLVIISRTASSGGYNNDANEIAAWASVTTPMISLSAYHVRSSRLQWIDSTTVNRSLDTYLLATDTEHPVFDGVTLEDGLAEYVFTEGFAPEYMGNCVIGSLDAGNGTVIAQTFSDETVIAEWPAGVPGYDGADVVQAGNRLLFCAGTQDTAGAVGQGGWNLTDVGAQMFANAIEYMLSLPPAGPTIAWVTETVDRDEDGVQDDQLWTDWLIARGFNVEIQPDRYLTMGDEQGPDDANDYVAELNAADVVIISRTASSGGYNNDANEIAAWASVTSPMISLSAYHVRSSRLQWIDSTTVNRSLDTYILSLDEGHAIFDGVTLEDGLVEMLFTEGFAPEYMGNCVIGSMDAGNGTIIAQTFSDEIVIAEWPAGMAGYDGADVVQAGPRLLFCAGTQDTAGAVGQGGWNLTGVGAQMFLNAINYMLPLGPVHSYTFEDGTANDSVGDADGTLFGDSVVTGGVLVTDGDADWMEMDGSVIAINTYDEITLELWAQEDVDNPYTGTASFGGTWEDNGYGMDYIMLSVGRGDSMNRIMVANTPDSDSPWADEIGVSSPEIVDGMMHHYVATITNDMLAYYIDGELIGTVEMGETTIAGLSNDFVYLGKGVYSVDAAWAGSIDEFNIYNKALTKTQVMSEYIAGPSVLTPIDIENFSFELPGTEKIKGWNGEGVSDTPAEDIPGWASDIEVADSGVESDWPGSTEGVWTGFIMGDDPSIWNLTDHVIAAGEKFVLKVDLQDNWTDGGLPDVIISLYYDDAGTRVTVASATVTPPDQSEGGWAEYVVSFAADDAPDSVGNLIGVEIDALSASSWIGVDNVRLGLAD